MNTLAFLDLVSPWWEALDLPRQVFFGIGIIAGLLAIIMTLLAVVGLEHHDALDAVDADIDHGGGGIFSIKPLTGFFLGFGWTGGLALDGGLGMFTASALGLVAGLVLMGVIVAMFRGIHAMRSDGTMRIADALNATGTVYVTLPPSKAPGGQVVVSFKGRQETFAALSLADRPLPGGERVKVVQIIDSSTVMVEPL